MRATASRTESGRSTAAIPPQNLFRKLESLDKELEVNVHTGHNRWILPYADLLTLLLGFFVVLFAAARMQPASQAVLADRVPDPSPMAAPKLLPKPPQDSRNLPITPMHEVKPTREQREDMALATRLRNQLQSGLDMRGIEIRPQERGLVISLKDSILFAPGSADLSPAARQTLDQLATRLSGALNGAPRPIRVEGHTDNTPIATSRYPSNWELSTARATNIVRYLVGQHHFSSDRLSAAGYGEFKPVDDNSSIEGKQKNRRVDIVVLNESTAQQEPPALATGPGASGGAGSRED